MHSIHGRGHSRNRDGFTLVEILVVMVIIAILLGLAFPAINKARESARKTSCANNMRQLSVALLNFETRNGHYPSGWVNAHLEAGTAANESVSGWSAQALLLPFLEQDLVHSQINFGLGYNNYHTQTVTLADGSELPLAAMRVPTFMCPSERRDEAKGSLGGEMEYPLNYAFNAGIWFVYDPETNEGGPGAFYPNSKLDTSNFTDGLNTTLAFAEVRAFTKYYRNAGHEVGDAEVANPPILENQAAAGDPIDLRLRLGDGSDPAAAPAAQKGSGHAEWVDGRVHQAGFTTAFAPNALTIPVGETEPHDWTNWQEGKASGNAGMADDPPTYAAVTARSYHGGGVNVLTMGGTVQWIRNDINLNVYRALSTRAGGELIPNDDQF